MEGRHDWTVDQRIVYPGGSLPGRGCLQVQAEDRPKFREGEKLNPFCSD